MPIPSTKVSIPKVQHEDRRINQLQQNMIDGIRKLQLQIKNLSTCVGESKTAYLTEDQFQSEWGPGWVLQDGRSCVGSAYQKLYGFDVIPNACGRVQRMADNGAGVNPDGELELGSTQAEAFKAHTHPEVVSLGVPANSVAVTVAVASAVDGVGNNDTNTSTGSAGGNETRMVNVTVNFFLRID